MGTVFGEANKMLWGMAWMFIFTGSFVWPSVHSNQIDSYTESSIQETKTQKLDHVKANGEVTMMIWWIWVN